LLRRLRIRSYAAARERAPTLPAPLAAITKTITVYEPDLQPLQLITLGKGIEYLERERTLRAGLALQGLSGSPSRTRESWQAQCGTRDPSTSRSRSSRP
jgi:hypothetical protein